MKTIIELWNELINHPDYIHGSIWTKNDVIGKLTDELEEYLIDSFDYEEMDSEWIEEVTSSFIEENKIEIQKIIYDYENYNYKHDCWSIDFDDYEFPNNPNLISK